METPNELKNNQLLENIMTEYGFIYFAEHPIYKLCRELYPEGTCKVGSTCGESVERRLRDLSAGLLENFTLRNIITVKKDERIKYELLCHGMYDSTRLASNKELFVLTNKAIETAVKQYDQFPEISKLMMELFGTKTDNIKTNVKNNSDAIIKKFTKGVKHSTWQSLNISQDTEITHARNSKYKGYARGTRDIYCIDDNGNPTIKSMTQFIKDGMGLSESQNVSGTVLSYLIVDGELLSQRKMKLSINDAA